MSAWWRRRTIHARLSLLVTGAVAVAVVTLATLAWTAVVGIQKHEIQSELNSDAQAIAAQPDQWSATSAPLPGPGAPPGKNSLRPHDLGARWQILDAAGTVVSYSTSPLPVTAGAGQVAAGQVPAGRHRRVQEQITVAGDTYLMLTVPASGGGAVQVAINQDPTMHTLTVFGLLLVGGCLLCIAIAAVLGRAVARTGLSPLDRLTEAVEDVVVSLDLSRQIAVTGIDEIARLGRVVNTLLGAIDTARRAQRTLVEDAGHELRTPLTSIRTNIELLLEVEQQPELAHRLPAEERRKLLRDLDTQVKEMATLTTELVELAREDATREPIERVDLTEVIEAAITRVRIRAPAITFTTDLEPVAVAGRAGELERMVLNVLDNAAKWSPSGATVHTELHAQGAGWCNVTVADTGPGIDEADRPHVFARFYRAPAARGMTGSGLGLAIVNQTATQHGGSVTAEARSPHGTVITIRLPRFLVSS